MVVVLIHVEFGLRNQSVSVFVSACVKYCITMEFMHIKSAKNGNVELIII